MSWMVTLCGNCEQPLGIDREATVCSHLRQGPHIEVVPLSERDEARRQASELAEALEGLREKYEWAERNQAAGIMVDTVHLRALFEAVSRYDASQERQGG